ncbi:MAG TPA: sigma-70 family RNA polymerase sigma factor [Puia sp.]|nr:sigma-70 family RNA polymerase sigma factor [Puia sp.]
MQNVLTIEKEMNSPSRKNISTVIGQFGKRLLGFIRKRVNNEADAEDILQDVWYQFTATAEPIEQLGSWLFTVARNKITDRYRKKKPEFLEDLLSTEDGEGVIGFKDILFDDSNNPETEHLRSLFWEILDEALQELPKEQRDVFVLNELEDIPFKDIAEKTGASVNTLISRKRYAVLHLRNRLQDLRDELLNY